MGRIEAWIKNPFPSFDPCRCIAPKAPRNYLWMDFAQNAIFSHLSNSPHKNYRSPWLVYKQMWPSATLQSPSFPKRGMKWLISDCGWYATPDESFEEHSLHVLATTVQVMQSKICLPLFSNPFTFCFSTLSKAYVLSKADFSKSGKGHYICALSWPHLSRSMWEEDV